MSATFHRRKARTPPERPPSKGVLPNRSQTSIPVRIMQTETVFPAFDPSELQRSAASDSGSNLFCADSKKLALCCIFLYRRKQVRKIQKRPRIRLFFVNFFFFVWRNVVALEKLFKMERNEPLAFSLGRETRGRCLEKQKSEIFFFVRRPFSPPKTKLISKWRREIVCKGRNLWNAPSKYQFGPFLVDFTSGVAFWLRIYAPQTPSAANSFNSGEKFLPI